MTRAAGMLPPSLLLFAFCAASAAAAPAAPAPALSAAVSAAVSVPEKPRRAVLVPITLDEAYRDALEVSETIAISSQTLIQAMTQIQQLWAAAKPYLTFQGSQLFQTRVPSQFLAFSPPSQQLAQFNLQQTLFSGFRELLAVKAGESNRKADVENLIRAKQMLYQSVGAAYVNLLNLQRNAVIDREMLGLLADRLKDLRGLVDLGRSRESDWLATASQRSQLRAQLAVLQGQEAAAQELLAFLTGVEARFLPQELPLPRPRLLQDYLVFARERPDVRAQQLEVKSAGYQVTIAKRAMIPMVSLNAHYYAVRPGFYKVIKWDTAIQAMVPIYSGGQIMAGVRMAESQLRSAEKSYSLALRTARQEIRTYYGNVEYGLAGIRAFREADSWAAKSAEAQSRDYKNGLVTNIVVLDSLNALQQTRLGLEGSRAQTLLSEIQLRVASGKTPEVKAVSPGGVP